MNFLLRTIELEEIKKNERFYTLQLERMKAEERERSRRKRKPKLGYIIEFWALMKDHEQEQDESKKKIIERKARDKKKEFKRIYKLDLLEELKTFKKKVGS